MKSILLTAILATVGIASKVNVLSYTNQATPIDFGLPTNFGVAQAYYDVNFGYDLEGDIVQGDQDGVMDAWVQAALFSNVDFYININILNTDILNIKINTAPFHIIPLWASFYYTHPAAVYQGIVDEFAAAFDFGYELHTGEVNVFYYQNSLMPKVSLSDLALGLNTVTNPAVPGTTFASNAGGINGWDWNVDANNAWVAEPYLSFDLLDWLINEGKVEIDNYASYLFIPLVNEGDIAPAQ
jgi:hypothetical protein